MNKRAQRRETLGEAISLEIRRSQNRTDAYDEAVCVAIGVNRTDLRCLDIVSQEGTITAGRLAELAGLTSGAVTAVLDRLERTGYARRQRDEADRRRVLVELTERAHAVLWPHYEPIATAADKLYSRFSESDLQVVLDFLQAGAELFGRRLDELRSGLRPPQGPD